MFSLDNVEMLELELETITGEGSARPGKRKGMRGQEREVLMFADPVLVLSCGICLASPFFVSLLLWKRPTESHHPPETTAHPWGETQLTQQNSKESP